MPTLRTYGGVGWMAAHGVTLRVPTLGVKKAAVRREWGAVRREREETPRTHPIAGPVIHNPVNTFVDVV